MNAFKVDLHRYLISRIKLKLHCEKSEQIYAKEPRENEGYN